MSFDGCFLIVELLFILAQLDLAIWRSPTVRFHRSFWPLTDSTLINKNKIEKQEDRFNSNY